MRQLWSDVGCISCRVVAVSLETCAGGYPVADFTACWPPTPPARVRSQVSADVGIVQEASRHAV